jgi:hypothetical protein
MSWIIVLATLYPSGHTPGLTFESLYTLCAVQSVRHPAEYWEGRHSGGVKTLMSKIYFDARSSVFDGVQNFV